MTILVTGATGFVGRHLVRRLMERGEDVLCLVRESSDVSVLPKNATLVQAPLLDADRLSSVISGCTSVFHLAAMTSAQNRHDLYRTNVLGSRAVAAACHQVGSTNGTSPTLVLVSSIAAGGTAVAGRARTAFEPAHPVSEYGKSKRGGEIAACDFAGTVPISIVRPGIVLGLDSHELQPMFESIGKFRIHVVPGYTVRRYAVIHIDELVEILIRVAARGRRCQPRAATSDTANGSKRSSEQKEPAAEHTADHTAQGIYVAATSSPTYAELGRILGRAMDVGLPLVLPVPEPLAWLAAAGAEIANRYRGRQESFNLDKMREAFAGDWVGATNAISEELGFQPDEAIEQKLARSFRSAARSGDQFV